MARSGSDFISCVTTASGCLAPRSLPYCTSIIRWNNFIRQELPNRAKSILDDQKGGFHETLFVLRTGHFLFYRSVHRLLDQEKNHLVMTDVMKAGEINYEITACEKCGGLTVQIRHIDGKLYCCPCSVQGEISQIQYIEKERIRQSLFTR